MQIAARASRNTTAGQPLSNSAMATSERCAHICPMCPHRSDPRQEDLSGLHTGSITGFEDGGMFFHACQIFRPSQGL